MCEHGITEVYRNAVGVEVFCLECCQVISEETWDEINAEVYGDDAHDTQQQDAAA